jgi:hypothetical protein
VTAGGGGPTPAVYERVRAHCLALPDTSERLSHGEPTWFVRKKVFVMSANDHHGDGRIAIWVPAPEGRQAGLVAAAPEHYFVPPYVGHRGWVGVRLDTGLEWDAVAGAVEEAYIQVAPAKLVEALAGGD